MLSQSLRLPYGFPGYEVGQIPDTDRSLTLVVGHVELYWRGVLGKP